MTEGLTRWSSADALSLDPLRAVSGASDACCGDSLQRVRGLRSGQVQVQRGAHHHPPDDSRGQHVPPDVPGGHGP